MKMTLIEKMESMGVPKSWVVAIRSLEKKVEELQDDKQEYGLIIETLAAKVGDLQEVVNAAKWKPDYRDMRQAIRWSKTNYRVVGDYPTIKWGAESYLDSERVARIDEAVASLPED